MPIKAKPKPKNANGKGTVYFEKDRNKWRAIVTDPQGNRIPARFNTKAEADEWVTIQIADMYKGVFISPDKITLGEWYIEFLTTYVFPDKRPNTIAEYLRIAQKTAPISDCKLQSITATQIQKFYNNLPKDMAESTKLKIHKQLKRVFKKASQLGMIKKNVMLDVTPPAKLKKTKIEVFTIEELHLILDTIQNSRYYQKYYLFIKLAAITGARIGELLGLKFSNVRENGIYINNIVEQVKGKVIEGPPKTESSEREITIPANVSKELLQEALVGKVVNINGYVFHTLSGRPYSPSNMERTWRGIMKETGLPYRKFHTLRHTYATQMLAAGTPLLEVTAQLGHADASYTLDLYGHTIPGYTKILPDKLQTVFAFK